MDVIAIDPELTRRLAADLASDGCGFHFEVSPRDEMFLHALTGYRGNANRAFVTYLLQGKQMLDQLRPIVDWSFGGWDRVDGFLDFASGYGRFTRHLIQELPPERVVVSDIYADAVRFQREYFGVGGVPSAANPYDLPLDRSFDLIFVSSLFTHLPERTFLPWLAKLISLLTPRGLLIFTTRGAEPSDGDFVYRQQSESRTLDPTEYGTTLVSEAFVQKCLAQVLGSDLQRRRIEHDHLGFQDLYVVSKDPRTDLSGLAYRRGFSGHVGACWLNPDGALHLRGWAANFDTDPCPVRIEVYCDEVLVQECSPDQDRPDVAKLFAAPQTLRSGWTCRLAPPQGGGGGGADRSHRVDHGQGRERPRSATHACDRSRSGDVELVSARERGYRKRLTRFSSIS